MRVKKNNWILNQIFHLLRNMKINFKKEKFPRNKINISTESKINKIYVHIYLHIFYFVGSFKLMFERNSHSQNAVIYV